MFRTQLSGHIGKDAEIQKYNGKFYFNFSVANNFSTKKENKWVETTQWEQCSIVVDEDKKNNLDYLKKSLVKGAFVFIDNMIYKLSNYTSKDGEEKASLRWFVRQGDITIVQTKKVVETTKNDDLDVPDDLPF